MKWDILFYSTLQLMFSMGWENLKIKWKFCLFFSIYFKILFIF